MSDIRCIGIATGGGDPPGLNAVIRAATKAAILKYKWKVIGVPDGFDGLIWPEKSGFFPAAARFWASPTAAILSITKPSSTAKKFPETSPPK
jgi:hypothetical protein